MYIKSNLQNKKVKVRCNNKVHTVEIVEEVFTAMDTNTQWYRVRWDEGGEDILSHKMIKNGIKSNNKNTSAIEEQLLQDSELQGTLDTCQDQ